MSNIDTLMRMRGFFGAALRSTMLTAIAIICAAVMLTAMQVAFAAPSPP